MLSNAITFTHYHAKQTLEEGKRIEHADLQHLRVLLTLRHSKGPFIPKSLHSHTADIFQYLDFVFGLY